MRRLAIAAVVLALGAFASSSVDAGLKWFGHRKKTYYYSASPCSTCGTATTSGDAGAPAPIPEGHGAPAPQPYDEKAGLPADKGPDGAKAAPVAPPPPPPKKD